MSISTHTSVSYLTIDADQAGQRLDNFLLRHLKPLPRSHLYRIIRKGEVRVNKKRCDPDYRLQAGDLLRVPPVKDVGIEKPRGKLNAELAQQLKDSILYEDKQLLIINKPAGMAVHGGSGIRLGVIEACRLLYPQQKHLELVHRLDRDTSGCLLLAKKPSVLRECHALLREAKVTKRYLLLAKGHWPARLTKVSQALHKNHLQSGERMVQADDDGKPSVTHFQVKQRYAQVTLVEARPETGRTHQIRVHATWAGHPIVGDDKYGDEEFNRFMKAYGCSRLFLHAAGLSFQLADRRIDVEAPLDKDLKKCLTRLPQ